MMGEEPVAPHTGGESDEDEDETLRIRMSDGATVHKGRPLQTPLSQFL